MGQLTKERADQLWPKKSSKIFFLAHSLNGGEALRRCLKSVKPLTDNILVLVDSRTSDNTREIIKEFDGAQEDFMWRHSFSHAKNLCIQKAMDLIGLEIGDWLMFMGSDFELQAHTVPALKEFIKDETNFFCKFWVPEYTPNPWFLKWGFIPWKTRVVTRQRSICWRHHEMIFWEKSCHEEALYSGYRLTGIGLDFLEEKELPCVGGKNGMLHYGYHEDGGEHGKRFLWKKDYYLVLTQIDAVRYRCNFPETDEGIRKALCRILNKEVLLNDCNKEIENLVARYVSGDKPKGLAKFVERMKLKGVNYDL